MDLEGVIIKLWKLLIHGGSYGVSGSYKASRRQMLSDCAMCGAPEALGP